MGVVVWMEMVVMMPNCVTAIATCAHIFKTFKSVTVSVFAMELKA
jgi:hypothetical protein